MSGLVIRLRGDAFRRTSIEPPAGATNTARMAKLRSRLPSRPRVETLEPRILYSADPAPVAIVNELATALVQSAQTTADPVAATAESTSAVTEWVIIDLRVPDSQSLIADLQSQRDAGRQIGWMVVDETEDAVAAISELLAGQESVRALHLVAHGEAGSVQIGRETIDLNTLRGRAGEFASWSEALSADADLLVYGCDVAAGERGSTFVQALAALTGADVAASVDATGVLRLGGDWELESASGQIEAVHAFAEPTRDRWEHLLNAVPAGAETRVNNSTAGDQNLAPGRGSNQAIALPGGGAFVVWENTNNNMIFGRVISASGATVGTDIQISSSGVSASEPAVAFDVANNRIVVAWTSAGEDGSSDGIFSRVLDISGTPVSAVTQVNQASSGNQNQVAVAINANGMAVFTWTDDTFGSTMSIAARGYDYTTSTWYAQLIVNDSTGAGGGWADPWVQRNSAIAFADDGQMLVVWESEAQDGDGKGIYGQLFDNSLVSKGLEFRISTASSGDQFSPVVAGGAGGEFVVGWTDDRTIDSVFGRQYQADGSAKSAPFELQPVSLSDQGELSIAMTAGGGFVFAYDSFNAPGDGDQQGIFFGEYANDRTAKGFVQLLNTTTKDEQKGPTIVVSGTSGYVVWQGEGPGDSKGIVLRGFDLVYPTVVVTPLAGTTTTEAGGSAAFEVQLSTAPATSVVVNLSSSRPEEGTVSKSSLTFTTSNWNVAQSVTVTGVDDNFVDGTQTYNLVANPSSFDPQYGGLGNILTPLQNSDNDNRNIIVVTTLDNSAGGDVSSIAALYADMGSDGKISLREAIDAANATDNGVGGSDIIRFDPGLANGVINVGSALPVINQAVWIDAITGMGFVDRPLITLNGNNGAYNGLEIGSTGGGSKISGLAIVDFGSDGILLRGSSNTIEHNHLGIQSDGVTDNGNARGLHAMGGGNAIRNNLISGNLDDGILVNGGVSNAIEDNRIGVDLSASSKVGNGGSGIHLLASGNNMLRNNTIGGNSTSGIRLQGYAATSNVVAGSFIGTNSGGTVDLGNAQSGVMVHEGANANRVGGANISDGNLIAYNTKFGVHVYDGTGTSVGNQILSNQIYANGAGIALGTTGLEIAANPPNDALDSDTGGNNYQNTPVLISAVPGPGVVQITGELNSEPLAGYRIQFFASPTANVSGFGEGTNYLGHLDVTTDGAGLATFSVSPVYTGSEGSIISATATRYDNLALRWADTSPFSANVAVSAAPVWSTSATASVAEGLTPVATLAATDPDGPSASIVYSIVGGADAGQFQLVGSALSFVSPRNFESPASAASSNTYVVVLRATDVANEHSDLTLSVTVSNVAEAPDWLTATTQSINEGNTSVASLSASDPDNNPAPIAYSIVGGSDQSRFQLVGSQLQFVVAPDFEAPTDSNNDNVYNVRVRATDGGSDFTERDFAVTVQGVNDAPVFTGPSVTLSLDENLTLVANLTATDQDGPTAAIVYSIAGGADAGRFQLAGDVLSFVAARDFETPSSTLGSNTYSVTLRATDAGGAFSNRAVAVNINNVAELPVWLTAVSHNVNEGATTVTSLSASDPDNNIAGMAYSIVGGTDQSRFQIVGSQLQFVAPPDFEAPTDSDNNNVYEVRVRATDGGGDVSDRDMAVTILGTNDAPVFTGLAASVAVAENQTAVATVTATDPDGPTAAIVYSIVGGADAGRFQLTGDVLSFVSARDFEAPSSTAGNNTYSLVLRATDGGGAFTDQAVDVTITNVAEAPVWQTAGAISHAENATFVVSLSATDPDATPGPMTYAILTGASSARFTLSGSNLMFVVPPDYEVPSDVDGDNVFGVQIRATDAGGDHKDRWFIITLTDVNEAPVFASPTALQVAENTRLITTVTGSDPESGTSALTYSINGGADAALFEINGSTGELRFKSDPDFEQPLSASGTDLYAVDLRVADTQGLSQARAFTVQVTDQNEAPVIQGPGTVSTTEDSVFRFDAMAGAGISLLDPDLVAAPVVVQIRADSGVLTLAGVQGLVFTAGDGTADPQMQFTGELGDVAAALAGLRYLPSADFVGTAQISIAVADPSLPAAPATLTVAALVGGVNDNPVLVHSLLLDLPTGLQATLGSDALLANDVDNSAAELTYRIQALPSEIRLMLDGTTLRDGDRFTQADVDSGRLTVVSSMRSTAESTVRLQLRDTSGGEIDDIGLVIKSVAPVVGSGTSSGTGSGAGSGTSGATTGTGSGGSSQSESAQTSASSGAGAPLAISPSGNTRANNTAGGARGADPLAPVLANDNRQSAVVHHRDSQRGTEGQSQDSAERFKPQGSTAASRLALLDEIRREPGMSSSDKTVSRSEGFTDRTIKAVLQQRELLRDLDRVREQVGEKVTLERNFMASSAAVSASVSIGYVIWLIRGGVLLSSLLASIPAWSSIDPLPILSNSGGKRSGNDDDESLEELLSKARRAEEAQAAARAAGEPAPAHNAEVAVYRHRQ